MWCTPNVAASVWRRACEAHAWCDGRFQGPLLGAHVWSLVSLSLVLGSQGLRLNFFYDLINLLVFSFYGNLSSEGLCCCICHTLLPHCIHGGSSLLRMIVFRQN